MNTHSDFEDFFRLLESNDVEYMIVGGYAVAFHGYPRFTKDIDVFFDATPANAARLRAALVAFGFQPAAVSDDVLLKPDAVVAIGIEPVRIDLLGRVDGVTFAEAREATVRGRYDDCRDEPALREDGFVGGPHSEEGTLCSSLSA